ncbi:hypothetical protein BDA99DRAFT_492083 [Phascolomyces articulosus]|uniref:Uncharacterized protein n=1 Tax=Phascolomyces articulosus TaxID=60185 RepID=A0AAD5PK99_9FUNG|nr:hypothetical protein BDA99DRAFT_492083 [Phascolomyces articulosus]
MRMHQMLYFLRSHTLLEDLWHELVICIHHSFLHFCVCMCMQEYKVFYTINCQLESVPFCRTR